MKTVAVAVGRWRRGTPRSWRVGHSHRSQCDLQARSGHEIGGLAGGGLPSTEMPSSAAVPLNDPAEEQMVQFMSSVLDSAQAGWARSIRDYSPAVLVLFRDGVTTACGNASAASGPFYCPG